MKNSQEFCKSRVWIIKQSGNLRLGLLYKITNLDSKIGDLKFFPKFHKNHRTENDWILIWYIHSYEIKALAILVIKRHKARAKQRNH